MRPFLVRWGACLHDSVMFIDPKRGTSKQGAEVLNSSATGLVKIEAIAYFSAARRAET
jgi:hypothetical protein